MNAKSNLVEMERRASMKLEASGVSVLRKRQVQAVEIQ